MKTIALNSIALLSVTLLASTESSEGQGALTPTSAPAPSMRTLQQIEPRTPVDDTHTPGDANSLFKITSPGSYYLTGNISFIPRLGDASQQSGIEIQSNDVTLDLNGFRVSSSAGTNGLNGIIVNGNYKAITIKNGTVAGWNLDGIAALGVTSGTFENLTLDNNNDDGLVVGGTASIRNCRATNNKNRGIVADNNSTISDCEARSNPKAGIVGTTRCVISRCVVADATSGDGIVADNYCIVESCTVNNAFNFGIKTVNRPNISNCTVTDCGHVDVNGVSGGILLHYAGTVRNCAISFNRIGIEILGSSDGGGALIENNQLDSNSGGGIDILSSGNRIDNNSICCSAGPAIRTHEGGNFIVRNHAIGNNGGAADYVLGGNDTVGPIVVGKGTISGIAGGTSPWANFQQ